MNEPKRDEHAGMGGSYQVDPATGKRTLVERHGQPAENKPAPAPAAAKPVKKEA